MRTFDQWMSEYGVSHTNQTNQLIHKIAVPAIMLSVVGLLWSIPVPQVFLAVPYLNWATLFIVGCLGFYLSLNAKMFAAMLFVTALMCGICVQLQNAGVLLPASIGIFVVAWIAQFYGHRVEGKKPSFLQDLVFLLIGPLWVLRFFFEKIGVRL